MCRECGRSAERGGSCERDGAPLDLADDMLLGTTIGRYRLARLLGRGGMGRVYLAVQPEIGSRVAIKVLPDDCVDDAVVIERFFDEARAVNLVRHDGIVNIIDLDRLPDGRPYIVMEYVDGRTLREVVSAGPVPLGGAVAATIEVLLALDAAHAVGVVHRDLKPDNVIITSAGHAKVLDFGVAKLQDAPGRRTASGAMVGTPHYMAPEQIRGRPVDARTDVYGAGAVLFELATGRLPFEADSEFEIMRAHVEAAPPHARPLRPDLPEALDAVIARALAKDPAERFQTAKDMARALRESSSELPLDQWRSLTPGAWLAPAAAASTDFAAPTPLVPDTPQTSATVPAKRISERALDERRMPAGRRSRRLAAAIALVSCVLAVAIVAVIVATRARDLELVARPASDANAALAPAEAGLLADMASDTAADMPAAEEDAPRIDAGTPPRTTPPRHTGVRHRAPPRDTDAIDAAPAEPQVTAGETGRDGFRVRPGYDPTRMYPLHFLPRALLLARKLEADAELTYFASEPMAADGYVDLTRGYALYHFNSPSRAHARTGSANDPPCEIMVELSPASILVHRESTPACSDKPVSFPRCPVRWVLTSAQLPAATFDDRVKIVWRGNWSVTAGSSRERQVVADDCR